MGSLDDQTDAEAQARFDALAAAYLALAPGADIPLITYFSISSNGLANLTGCGPDGISRVGIATREKALALALADLKAAL